MPNGRVFFFAPMYTIHLFDVFFAYECVKSPHVRVNSSCAVRSIISMYYVLNMFPQCHL